MRTWKRAGAVLLWTLTVLAAAAFVAIGVGKFNDPSWARKFARWGYPDGFYMVIGALEVAGGILLLVPRTASYGAALTAVIMIGAAATHAIHGEMARVLPPVMYLLVVSAIGWCRRGRAIRPAGRHVAAATPV